MDLFNNLKTRFWTRQFLQGDSAILVYLALAKLMIHLLTSIGYGYFGDEFYWLAMTKHLDFGYADVPPLTSYLAAINRFLLGTSMFAIHILPAVAGAVMVYLAGLTARELGGGRFAQWLSALAVLVAPYILFLNSVFTYDPFDQLCTIILFYLVVRVINKETPKRWLLLGVVAGLGAMTKLSAIYACAALVISLLLTSRRKSFLTVWPWLALGIAALICTPFLVWQSVHGWPVLAYFHSYALSPGRPHPKPGPFFVSLALHINLFLAPVLLLGLVYLLFHGEGRKYRILGFTFLVLTLFYTGLMKLESRQIVSACFPIMAAGAVWLERLIAAAKQKIISWFKWAYVGIVVVGAALLAPGSLPILPIHDLVLYWVNRVPAFVRDNDYQPGAIPHHFKFSLGWPEMVKPVAMVYQNMREVDQKKCVIWAANYWDAGAIDVLGEEYGLPDAVSNHHAYQIWGEERFSSSGPPEVAIVLPTTMGYVPMRDYFQYVAERGVLSYGSSYNSFSIYMGYDIPFFLCRYPKADFLEAWKQNMSF